MFIFVEMFGSALHNRTLASLANINFGREKLLHKWISGIYIKILHRLLYLLNLLNRNI